MVEEELLTVKEEGKFAGDPKPPRLGRVGGGDISPMEKFVDHMAPPPHGKASDSQLNHQICYGL